MMMMMMMKRWLLLMLVLCCWQSLPMMANGLKPLPSTLASSSSRRRRYVVSSLHNDNKRRQLESPHPCLIRMRGGGASITENDNVATSAADAVTTESVDAPLAPVATTTLVDDASATDVAVVEDEDQDLAWLVQEHHDRTNASDSSSLLTHAGSSSMAALALRWRTDLQHGLTEAQASRRLVIWGPNRLTPAQPKLTILQLIVEQFQDTLVQILVGVAILSALFSYLEVVRERGSNSSAGSTNMLKYFVEPAVILAILIINAAVGVIQSQSASDSLQALSQMQSPTATVLRRRTADVRDDDNDVMSSSMETTTTADHTTNDNSNNDSTTVLLATVDAQNLVPGDVIRVRAGDKVPADARLVSIASSSLQVDEGSLTGESVTVSKLPGNLGSSSTSVHSTTSSSSSSPALIQDQKGMLYSGTVITSGAGTAVVVRTGMDTEFGKIQQGVTEAAVDKAAKKTPLGLKLDEFGRVLTYVIGGICALVWLVSIPKMNDPSFGGSFLKGALYYAKVAVALGVAAIPEGLPAVITLCLSLGTRRMAQRNVIVRKLPSVETLGCTTVICTDKTGTLTTNEMTAVSLVVLEHSTTNDNNENGAVVSEHAIDGYSYSPMGQVHDVPSTEVQANPLGSIADIAAVAALCNDAQIIGHDANQEGDNNNNNAEKAFERVGEPTEAALCILSEKLGGMPSSSSSSKSNSNTGHMDRTGFHVPPSVLASAHVDAWRSQHPRFATLEFNRDRKSMSVLCEFPKGDYPSGVQALRDGVQSRQAGNRLLVKGAPNLLLERCTHVKFRDGTVATLQGPLRRMLEEKLSEMAARPLRCLALAIKEQDKLDQSLQTFRPSSGADGEETGATQHPLLSNPDNYKAIESGLTLVGVVGIKDPARPEVANSIQECTKAGIRVIMITGDAKDTAVAIAKDVNIFPADDSSTADMKTLKAFEGREFFNKPEHEQLDILKTGNIVFCRAEPSDKRKLIKMLSTLKEVTAMTGDGVNDAPALKQADIGIAMGITGTEVSKEAADMILADDNFSTIVSAVEEGRRIYANMQAFICFLISCNIGEICAIFFATLAGFPEPLTAMHLLWVNLVTDGPPATALGFNPASPDLMDRPPRPSDEPILTKWLLTRYCVTGLYVGLATIGIFAQHYLQSERITLSQLARWSRCGKGWTPSANANGVIPTCADLFEGSARALPQTLALTTLVCMEMLKALSAISMDSSILKVGPHQNKWLLYGVAGPLLLHLLVLYSSKLGMAALGESFGMVPLSKRQWMAVLGWALPILLIDEILKFIGRCLITKDQEKKQNEAAMM